MSRRLFGLGLILIVVTLGLWVAEVAVWIPTSTEARWSGLTLNAGLTALAVGFLFRILTPIAGLVPKERCTVCGRGTARGHTYCLDHLQATVNATRDESRNLPAYRPKPYRAPGK